MAFQPQVAPQHYRGLEYDHKERFISYWKQIEQVVGTQPESVLEVGIGNGFVHRYLKEQLHVNVHTFDGDERLKPDTQGDVRKMPFADGHFDISCCFETLEHLPFEDFVPSLRELRRVARRFVLVSLPDVTPYMRVRVDYGWKKSRIAKFKDLPNTSPKAHEFDGQHYWEIGKKDFPLKRIEDTLRSVGLEPEEISRLEEDPYHRFFRCRVVKSSG